MVTKGIITSIDFNGNTCQVRIPLFETAGNDPITGTAIVSNTPGSYNGYKVGDVVLVAFEDGKMQNPVIVGKLYLGAAKEKQDPRGTINVETTTASKSASLPADAVLTANVDSNVPNTNTPFGSLASIANNLNSLNTDVNQLDRFTRNQFNSVITDVNDQGEELRSEIKQTAENIENKVVHKHQNGSQDALGWNLDEKEWKINAQDTVNGVVKDINIVTIDRNGMSIAGDLKLNGYPKNIIVRYAQNESDTKYPNLYNFKPDSFPDTEIDKTWYYNKYIKITEADKEKYVLISNENIDDYTITPGETVAYNREVNSKVWSTKTPERVDGKYIWQWTHTESFLFDKNTNSWNEQDDDKIVCITGAKGEKGDQGDAGYNTVTVMLYTRSKNSISGNPISIDLYYKFSDQKLYINDTCTTEYTLPEGWFYTISGAGDSSNGDLYCIAAVAHSNTESDKILLTEWAGPTLYVENGADGQPGVYIKEVKQWYILWPADAAATDKPSKPGSDKKPEPDEPENTAAPKEWMSTPPEAVNGYVVWTCQESIFSDDTPENRRIKYSDPVKDNAYALAQGKTTNYYSPTEPVNKINIGDCWFDTGYVKIDPNPNKKTGYLGKFVVPKTEPPITIHEEDKIYVKAAKDTESNTNGVVTRYIQIGSDEPKSTYLVKITPENIDKINIEAGTTVAYETGNLKQWDGDKWEDIAGELVTNKLTANYINAMDITAKKITVLNNNNAAQSDSNPTLFEADGLSGTGSVKIANFTVNQTGLYSGKHNEIGSTKDGVYLGADGISIGSNFKVTTGVDGTDPKIAIVGYTKSVEKKYCIVGFAVVTATTNKPAWWDDWNDANWSDTPPDRQDSSYIWEWTKTISTTDTDTDNTKDTKVCITGAKGDPGKDGTNGLSPYIGQNGNWWIGENDTNIKAEGLDGHTPEVTIGENGNWYIDGKDTGVLAKGTPGEQGKTGRSVLSVTKYYKLNSGKPEKPISKNPSDWYTSPPTFESGKNYYESDLTLYDSAVDEKDYSWSDVVENSMMTVDFINSLGITAKKITVLKDNSKESNDSNPILFQADGTSNNSGVKIGGFTVDSNRLYAGTPGADNGIELASFHNLIAYKSNNKGKNSTSAVSKITVNKATDLTVYIRSDAETDSDYTMISNPNVSSYPTIYSGIDVKAHTMGKQNSSSTLDGYTEVEYYGLKQNDWIYIVYKKDVRTSSGTDTGYLLIPETTDISIAAVGGTYYFERDTSLDIKEAGASLKVGSNFSVDSTGAIKSTSGTIGKLAINENGLSYENSEGICTFKIDPTVSNWVSATRQEATVAAGSALVHNALIIPGQSQGDYDQQYYWPAFDHDGFKVLYTSDWTGSSNAYKLGTYNIWDLAGIPIVSTYDHSMTREESLACYGDDRTERFGWGAPIIYASHYIEVGSDWKLVDLHDPSTGNIRKILTVVCTTYVQPTINNKGENTAPRPNQTGNLFVSYDNYSNGKFWIRSNTDTVTVSILAIGVAAIKK